VRKRRPQFTSPPVCSLELVRLFHGFSPTPSAAQPGSEAAHAP
jgi:hypothetical protein